MTTCLFPLLVGLLGCAPEDEDGDAPRVAGPPPPAATPVPAPDAEPSPPDEPGPRIHPLGDGTTELTLDGKLAGVAWTGTLDGARREIVVMFTENVEDKIAAYPPATPRDGIHTTDTTVLPDLVPGPFHRVDGTPCVTDCFPPDGTDTVQEFRSQVLGAVQTRLGVGGLSSKIRVATSDAISLSGWSLDACTAGAAGEFDPPRNEVVRFLPSSGGSHAVGYSHLGKVGDLRVNRYVVLQGHQDHPHGDAQGSYSFGAGWPGTQGPLGKDAWCDAVQTWCQARSCLFTTLTFAYGDTP